MNPYSEQEMQECVQQELNKISFPQDPNSLYANRFYDYQVAKNKCYNQNIVEGFNTTWYNIIKWIAIVLLVIVFFILIADFLTPKREIHLNIDTPSEMNLSTIPRF